MTDILREIEKGPLSYSQGAAQYGGESHQEFALRIAVRVAEECMRVCDEETKPDTYWPDRTERICERIRALAAELGGKNTPEGPNRDVSAGTSHSDTDGSASKPGRASSQAGATQGAAPIPRTCFEHSITCCPVCP